jgi:hypothetical protein
MPATAVFTPASAVGQHATAVARVEGGVGLDHFVDYAALSGWQRPTEGRNDASGNTPGKTEGVAHRDHKLSDLQLASVAACHWAGYFTPGTQHSEIGEGISADHVGYGFGAICKRSEHRTGSLDHMGASQHEAVIGQHAGAASTFTKPRPHSEACHTRQHPLNHCGHRG